MKVKAAFLVFDYDLYPRHQLDQICVSDYVNAMKAGAVFPPIVADKKSKRIIDGFKRTRATLKAFGADAQIDVEWRTYPDGPAGDAALIQDAISLNADHGERFSHYDMRRCVLLAAQFGLDQDKLAVAMRITMDRLETIRGQIHTSRSGEQVSGKQASVHLLDEPITNKQRDGIKRAGGGNQLFFVNQVINLIESSLLDTSSERLMERLEVLANLIRPLLRKVA